MKDKNSKIDFDFISMLEGSSRKAYVPDPENSRSGVTIASGFDLGHRSSHEINSNFDEPLGQKLLPYLGKIKKEACEAIEHRPLEINEQEERVINRYSHRQAENRIIDLWSRGQAHCEFDQLSSECQTVVASVAFQYGDLSRRTPNFWRQVYSGNWQGALQNLRNFGDKYPTRRNKEADLLASWLQQ